MTGDTASSDGSETAGSSMKRMRITINKKHVEILKDLTKNLHASKSEAIREAVVRYDELVSEDTESVYERLIDQLSDLDDRLKSIEDQLADLDESAEYKPQWASSQPPQRVHSQVSGEVNDNGDDLKPDLRDPVLKVILNKGPVSASSIAENLDEDLVDIKRALNRLTQQEMVDLSETDDRVKYTDAASRTESS